MTRQELLDEIDRRSRAGLFPSRDPDSGFCRYRTPDGSRKCFAGIAISDVTYREDFEGRVVTSCGLREALDPGVGLTGSEWTELQRIHDLQSPTVGVWDHDKVMAEVLALPFFAGMTPTPVEAAS